jgi:AcrR family transcriptional regulator
LSQGLKWSKTFSASSSERKTMNLENFIEETMVSLMKNNSVNDITVNMILEKSEVSKASFYRHYVDKFDLVNKIFDHLIPQEANQVGKTIKWSEFMLVLFDVFGKNRSFLSEGYKCDDYNNLVRHSNEFFSKLILHVLSNKNVDVTQRDIVLSSQFFAVSLNSFMIDWVEKGGQDTIYNLVRLMHEAVPHNIYPYFD